jgi:hypothetical protein
LSPTRKSGVHIAWKTITYRSVIVTVLFIAIGIAVVVNFTFPQATKAGVQAAENLLEKIAIPGGGGKGSAPSAQQAHFTNLDGTVRVKKGNSNSWVAADYALPLEKGDVIQTGAEGMAKVVFADGTNYTVKQDSLIVIEENSANASQQTRVAVNVTTGTVDLATATYVEGSKSQVMVAGATASLAPESSAMVRNDPRSDAHEILVKKGSSEVVRGDETVHLSDYEKVSFKSESPSMVKNKEIGPPTLISPANMMPIFISGDSRSVEFSWTAMANAAGYRLRVSKNPYFSSTLVDKKVSKADTMIPELGEGAYYWVVQSIDVRGKESVESEKNRFTVIPKGDETVGMRLEVDPFIQHGHVIEVAGRTEAGARVMVNGREVPLISNDGTFRFFTPPLPNGESVITITAQNSKGGVNTQQKKIVIQ